MFAEPLPCDREESVEMTELRAFVTEYEELMEDCMTGPLDPQDQKDLDEMYAALLLQEEELWQEGFPASPLLVETIRDRTDLDFPMLYFKLGLISGQNNTRSF